MNFNEIKNRLLIGALAITVFPFYVHAQNDKMEGQTAHRTKAWEIGAVSYTHLTLPTTPYV
mgnify:CR=1 FL=1